MKFSNLMITLVLSMAANLANADVITAKKIADKYATDAKAADPTFTGLSADEGKLFFNREVIQFKGDPKNPGKAIACATCHTENPADIGKHIVTGKPIKPLSPVVNSKRFSSLKNVEKQFTKHCNDVVGSDCSAREKGNYIAFLLTQKTPSESHK